MNLTNLEKEKYQKVWAVKDYRKVSPGELCAKEFSKLLKGSDSVVDIGCGTGRAARLIYWLGHNVKLFDIADNCLDDGMELPLTIGCMWEDPIPKADWGFCTDVMEHIPEEKIDDCLTNIAKSVEKVYFRIYLHKDNGKFIDEPLHLTVKPSKWWMGKLQKHWKIQMTENGTVATFIGE